MSAIQQLSKYGQIVICTFQQPRSIILRQCEQVLLLGHTGQTVYFGRLNDSINYFSDINIEQPENMSLGEFLLDIVTDANEADLAEYAVKYIESDNYKQLEEMMFNSQMAMKIDEHNTNRISYNHEFQYLMNRSVRTIIRNRSLFITHTVASFLLGILVGIYYFALPFDYIGLKNRTGLLYITSVYGVLSGVSVLRWCDEKHYTTLELVGGKYRTKTYYLAYFLSDTILLRILPSFLYISFFNF